MAASEQKAPLLTSVNSNDPSVNAKDSLFGDDEAIPFIDYSMLISDDPDQQSRAIKDLGRACLEYGCFIVINHGVPNSVIRDVLNGFIEFFNLEEEEKQKYKTKDPVDRIRWGKGDRKHVSREFLKIASHPTFHCPAKPACLTEIVQEYSKRMREVGLGILKGISRSLGLEECYIEKAMNLESGYDFFTANDYPPRQHSENRIGQFPHYDPSLLIFIIQNVSGGLQLEHNGKWLNANLQPNWIIANVADHLEILTNGKYKSAIHRVVVNNEVRRVTLPLFLGPSLDTFVSPALELADENHPPAYLGMTYKDYLEANQHHVIEGKSCLDQIRL